MINKQNLKRPVLILGIIIVFLLLAFKFGILSPEVQFQKHSNINSEIVGIKATKNLGEQVQLYKKLIERVGPEEAQEDLFRSGLPFTGQTHLLNHTIGDYLYQKYGPAGLLQCQDYFLSSCYHGFILHAIANGGMPEVGKAFNYCREAASTVVGQCAHAIGHGFLANVGYKNLTQALKTCDEAEKIIPGFPVYNCHDGVFMENIWAVHDGAPSPDRWVKPTDIQYPCDDKRIDDRYILACWSNQPSLAYQFFSAQGAAPAGFGGQGSASGGQGPIKKVADNLCNKVKRSEYQQMCFDGLARQIHPITNGSVEKTFSLCNLMPSSKWNNFCLSVNAGSGYSVGDRDVPFEICADTKADGKEECYSRLFSMIRAYKKPAENLKNLCAKVSEPDWRKKCESTK